MFLFVTFIFLVYPLQSSLIWPLFSFLQAVIFLESIFPSEKRIDLLDSLVEKFLTPEPTQGELASVSDKEEISSIFLEVCLKRTSMVIWGSE